MIRTAVADWMKTQSETALNSARAHNFVVTADAQSARVQTEAVTAASQAAERELQGHLDVARIAHGGE
jgi:hypothetical protein